MKKIAVIICGMEYGNQQELVQGIIRYSTEQGVNIHIFNCNADYFQSEDCKEGAFRIYDFANPKNYDGVILMRETLHYEPTQKRIVERLQESGIPVISVGARTAGMGYIGFEDYEAMYDMTEHVIQKHGVRRIAYIDGPEGYSDARQRAQAFRDVLQKEGIAFDAHWFFEGDFSVESGSHVVSELDRMHRMPEAVICANDCMAAGAVMELQNRGYRVPEDVMVTGFDNVALARDNSPEITTVSCAREEAGYRACEYLMTKSRGEILKLSVKMPTNLIYSESCGCKKTAALAGEELRRSLIRRMTKEKYYRRKMNELTTRLMMYDKLQDFIHPIKEFVPQLGADYLYVAFRNMSTVTKQMLHYYDERNKERRAAWDGDAPEKYEVPIIYEKGAFSEYGELEEGEILPKECFGREESGVSFIMPLHYRECFFGYCIISYCELAMEAEILRQWLVELGNSIENVLKQQVLQSIMEKLDRMSAFDSLTGLYNRVGFQIQTDKYKMFAKSSGRSLYISFIDIDGLKKVNDNFGHYTGDSLIKTIADCLRRASRKDEICMRFGGDEFIVLGLENVANSRHQEFERKFQENMQRVNEEEERGYLISASIGSYTIEDVENTNLQVVMERADMEMYLRKRKKKKELKE